MENETSDAKVPIVERHKEIDLIQSCINRMAQNSFQVKGWTVALFAVILALLPEKVESTNKFFLGVVMLAVSVMFWYGGTAGPHMELCGCQPGQYRP